ncbi:hypothetical protein K438DRAFT_1763746 [Mycena galopus ATCC 62051]|nr:hypothetical protein K438DRAFT_1763746 [Mycena galopus ATCC 62051]
MASTGPDSSTGECRAFDKKTREECDCSEYTNDPEDPGFCFVCGHRRKSHLAPANSDNGVKALLVKMLSGTGSKKPSSGSQKAGSSSSSKKPFPSLSAANREANAGMRPTKELEAGPSKAAKAKGKKKDNTANIFKVSTIVVLPQGIWFEKDGTCRAVGYAKTPNKGQMQKAIDHGLAVVDTSEGFEFDRTWSHEDLFDALTTHLPLPFSFFEELQHDANDDQPAWRIATVSRNRIEVLNTLTHPTGKDVDYHKGSSTTGFRSSHVFIVAFNAIPSEVLKEWVKDELKGKLIADDTAADMEFEDDPSTDNLDSDTDSSANGNPSPERIPRPNKRRLFSKASSDENESPPPKKLSKKGKGPAHRTWTREPEASNSGSERKPIIDLTADDAAASGKDASKSRASSEESIVDDPLVGDPYDKNRVYYF